MQQTIRSRTTEFDGTLATLNADRFQHGDAAKADPEKYPTET